MILAIDFDRTIHDIDNPLPGRRMGPPLPGAKDSLNSLAEDDHVIIIHSLKARTPTGARVIEDWMDYYHIPYDEVTAIKPSADYYVDDRALRHVDWPTTMQELGV